MPYFTHHQSQIFYRRQGEGPLLMVLPGNTASSACHRGELEYFSAHYCTVSLDFLGTGKSERVAVWPPDWWTQGTEQVRDLIEYLGYVDAILVGTSGGAVVALLAAGLYPQYIQAVVADSTVERFSPAMLRQNVIAERAQRTTGQVEFWAFAHGEDWEQVVDADTALIEQLAARGGDWLGGRLNKINCPVLLTASLADEALPDVASQLTAMAGQIPDCQVFLSNHGGHPLMWSQTKVFRRVVDSFLEGLNE